MKINDSRSIHISMNTVWFAVLKYFYLAVFSILIMTFPNSLNVIQNFIYNYFIYYPMENIIFQGKTEIIAWPLIAAILHEVI